MRQQFVVMRLEAAGPGETLTFLGRPFRVVPAVLVRSQVLHNNLGAALLPVNEFTEEWASQWNGIPVLVGPHPSLRGEPVSGRSATLWNERGAGWIFDARVEVAATDVRCLKGSVYLDVSRRDAVPGLAAVLDALDAKTPVELSTGFLSMSQAEEGLFRGEAYNLVMRPLGADHLVVSTTMTGACSVTDGCGLGVNQEEHLMDELVGNVLAAARTPTYSGTENTPWSSPGLADYVSGLDLGTVGSINDLTKAQKQKIAALTLLGDPGADNLRDLTFFPVVNPKNGKLNLRALRAVLGGRGSQANIPAAARDSAQAEARALLQAHNSAENEELEAGAEGASGSTLRAVLTRVGELILGRRALHQSKWDDHLAHNLAHDAAVWNMVEPSDQEKLNQLTEELQETYGTQDRKVVVRDVYSDGGTIVFWYMTPFGPEPPGDEFFQCTFADDKAGGYTFGSPMRVRRMTVYEPATADEMQEAGTSAAGNAAPGCGCGKKAAADNHTAEEPTMQDNEKKDLMGEITGAINAAIGPVTEKLGKLEASVQEAAKTAANAAVAELKATVDGLKATVDALGATVNAERDAERQALVAHLSANNVTPFTAADLESKPLDELRKLAVLAKVETRVINFAGRGGPRSATAAAENEEAAFAEPVPYWADNSKGKKEGEK